MIMSVTDKLLKEINKERVTKSITFAYPTSKTATELGFSETGCFYVQQTRYNIENSEQSHTSIAHNCEGFASPDHTDLIALFHEYDGDICSYFLKYGNAKALAAINAADLIRKRGSYYD